MSWIWFDVSQLWPDMKKNPASTHTMSNLRFYQKWITSSIHYHIPFHCVPCSKVMSLVFVHVAAYLRSYVSLNWCFGTGPLTCVGSLVLVFSILGKPWRASQCPVWNAMSTRKVQIGPLAFSHLCTSYIEPTLHPYYYHSLPSQKKQLEFLAFESYSPTQI